MAAILAIAKTAVGVVKGVTDLLGKDRVGKNEFYSIRDNLYRMLRANGLEPESVPGNPFQAFSHAAISDSPVKNYASELAGLKQLISQTWPQFNMSTGTVSSSPLNIVQDASENVLKLAQDAALGSPSVTQQSVSGAQNAAFNGGTIGDWTITKGANTSPLVWLIGGLLLLVGIFMFNRK